MFEFLNIDHFNLSKKTIGVRVDINSPIINGKIILNERIKAAAVTIKDLSERGAKQVVISHQGRKGKDDCISLKNHLPILEKEVGKKIKFSSEIYSKEVVKLIEKLKMGEILLLENLRFIDDETNITKKDNKILKLEKYFDYYVFDAFSVAHREHSSIIGFKNIPNIAGRKMEHEILSLNLIEESPNPHIYLFGGAKADDLISLIEKGLANKSVSLILLTGIIGEVALIAKGYSLGIKEEFLKKNGFLNVLSKVKYLIKKYPHNLIFPKDIALLDNKKRIEIKIENLTKNKKLLDKNLIQDIGAETVKHYSKLLKQAGSIYAKGTPGNFEEKGFEFGTRELYKEIVNSNAFTFMGGGHSVTAAAMFHDIEKFSYVSLAGGALVKFLSNEKLPGIEMLEKSYKKYNKERSDFTVVGSNVIDVYVDLPKPFSELLLGDKARIDHNFKETVGGGGVNTSISISRLSGKVSYLGKLSDESQLKLKSTLKKNGVSLINCKSTKRPCAKSIVIDTKENDRVILTYRGQNSYLDSCDFKLEEIHSKYIYFSTLSEQSFSTQIKIASFLKKQSKKIIICYNPSCYLIRREKKIKQIFNFVDILILNYEEAQELTTQTNINCCLKELKNKISKIVVITDGANGAYASDGKKYYAQKIIKARQVIDTTGAGDAFASTFFYFFSKGYGVNKSLNFAAKNSSSVVSKKGPVEGLLYYEDIIG